MEKRHSRLLLICLILIMPANLLASPRKDRDGVIRDSVQINFRFDNSKVDTLYRKNPGQIRTLDSLLVKYENDLDSITIISHASIEGNKIYNHHLSRLRSENVKTFIQERFPDINLRIGANGNGEDWDGLLKQVQGHNGIPDRAKLIAILENIMLDNDEKERRIKTLKNGEVFRYLNKYVFWNQRNSSSIILWHKAALSAGALYITGLTVRDPVSAFRTLPDRHTDMRFKKRKPGYPLFAIKTNLLFDAATALNAELEFPVKKRISIAGEWIFPFWKRPESDFTLNLLYGKADFKFWLGDRSLRPVMTGWFCDVYTGFGKYDFQPFSKKGVQGKLMNVGTGMGYAHIIHKNLRMEYSLGVGYVRTAYNKYEMAYETSYGDIKVVKYPWKKFYYNWVGPTRAAVSLVWMINRETSK